MTFRILADLNCISDTWAQAMEAKVKVARVNLSLRHLNHVLSRGWGAPWRASWGGMVWCQVGDHTFQLLFDSVASTCIGECFWSHFTEMTSNILTLSTRCSSPCMLYCSVGLATTVHVCIESAMNLYTFTSTPTSLSPSANPTSRRSPSSLPAQRGVEPERWRLVGWERRRLETVSFAD